MAINYEPMTNSPLPLTLGTWDPEDDRGWTLVDRGARKAAQARRRATKRAYYEANTVRNIAVIAYHKPTKSVRHVLTVREEEWGRPSLPFVGRHQGPDEIKKLVQDNTGIRNLDYVGELKAGPMCILNVYRINILHDPPILASQDQQWCTMDGLHANRNQHSSVYNLLSLRGQAEGVPSLLQAFLRRG